LFFAVHLSNRTLAHEVHCEQPTIASSGRFV
jgi:hypothetical protein